MRASLAGLAGLMVLAIASGRFPRGTANSRQFGLSAAPLTYAHEAARFAGRPGLPDRALVYDLRQAGVYLFHNGPQRKLFLDGRLEVPSRETFETYVWLDRMLNTGGRGWAQRLARMGDPLILLEHQKYFGAEATLLADPDWRCIYYDAIASVFVSRRRRDLEASFPSVDFAARHFQSPPNDPAWPAVLPVPWEDARARALLELGVAVRTRPGCSWRLGSSVVLLAGDHLRRAIALEPTAADPWISLGLACWALVLDPTAVSPRLAEPWDPARGLLPAQATFCFRRALELNPEETLAARCLDDVLQAQGMSDAEDSLTIPRHRGGPRPVPGVDSERSRRPIEGRVEPRPERDPEDREGLSRIVDQRLRQGRAEAAVGGFAEAQRRGIRPDWPTCDRVAATLLHLGRPAEARRVWQRAADPPAPALRLARLAACELAALDFAVAERTYRAALELDPGLGEARFGLALLHTQRGNAAEVLAAARQGLKQPLTLAQDSFLRNLEALAAPYAAGPGKQGRPESADQTAMRFWGQGLERVPRVHSRPPA